MKWAKTVRYQASVEVQGQVFNVLLEGDFDDSFAMYINKEYTCDVEGLPDYDRLEEIIRDEIELEDRAHVAFPPQY